MKEVHLYTVGFSQTLGRSSDHALIEAGTVIDATPFSLLLYSRYRS